MKKLFFILTAVFCVLAALSAMAEGEIAAMSFAPNPEEDFAFDAETGTITEYNGTAVDVVIPREIGGMPVRRIGYNAFDCARDYTDTDVMTNRKDWLRLRSVVLPETVEAIEDSAFSYCQQLELFVCYAPLSTTGRGVFMLCRGLKNAVFVNGVGEIDNYAFEGCASLERVDWGDCLARIGENAFNRCGWKKLVIDAETVDVGAFNHSALEEIVLTDRVREIHASAFYCCESLTRILCQFSEAERFVDGGPFGGIPATGVETLFPADTTEDQLKALKGKLNIWNGGHLGNGNEITLAEIAFEEPAALDPEILWEQLTAPSDASGAV